MAMGFNKVTLVGRITHDLDLKTAKTAEGDQYYVRFGIAVKGYNERVDFLNVIAWGDRGKNLVEYQRKGSKLLVEGRIATGTYEHEEKGELKTFDIVADNIVYLENKDKEEEQPKGKSSGNKRSANLPF